MGNVVKPKLHLEEEVCTEVISQKEGGLIEVRRERRRIVKVHDQGEKKMPAVNMRFEVGGTSPSNNKNMQIEKYQANE